MLHVYYILKQHCGYLGLNKIRLTPESVDVELADTEG